MVPEHTVGPGESLGASLQPFPVRRRNFAAALVGYCAAERRHVPEIGSLSGQGIAFPVTEILVPRTVTARDALYRIAARAGMHERVSTDELCDAWTGGIGRGLSLKLSLSSWNSRAIR